MKETLLKIKTDALKALSDAGADVEALRIQYLGKKGELTAVLRGMGKLSAEERPVVGQLANEVRAAIEEEIEKKTAALKSAALEAKLQSEKLDVTVPGDKIHVGKPHPIALVQRQLEEIFLGMGYSIADGPEVEYDYYNFQALNIPKDHPARDTQDTFYITENILLRSQTSPVQARVMEKQKPRSWRTTRRILCPRCARSCASAPRFRARQARLRRKVSARVCRLRNHRW